MHKTTLLLTLATTLVVLAPNTGASGADGAVVVEGTDVFLADFDVSTTCSGPATITLTVHKPGGDEVHVADVDSLLVPDTCFQPQCLDCPPVPLSIGWTMTGPGVDLVGGGVVYYDHYGYWEAAWSLQGTFDGSLVEARGAIG